MTFSECHIKLMKFIMLLKGIWGSGSMASREITNCGDCAYAQNDNGRLWCTFHDQAVSTKLACDDFMDEFDSPQWTSLISGMNAEEKGFSKPSQSSFMVNDIIAVILILLCIIISCIFNCIPIFY